jgi:hypothetical protein
MVVRVCAMTTNRADLDNSTSENGAEPVTLAFAA